MSYDSCNALGDIEGRGQGAVSAPYGAPVNPPHAGDKYLIYLITQNNSKTVNGIDVKLGIPYSTPN